MRIPPALSSKSNGRGRSTLQVVAESFKRRAELAKGRPGHTDEAGWKAAMQLETCSFRRFDVRITSTIGPCFQAYFWPQMALLRSTCCFTS